MPVFETTLQEGCGISAKVLLSSDQFKAALEHERLLLRSHPPNTKRGAFLRSDIFRVGASFNIRGQKLAKRRNPRCEHSLRERALLRLVGDSLVDAAVECLPENLRLNAPRWNALSSPKQIAMCRELYEATLSVESRNGEFTWQQDTFDQPISRILPRLYGKVGEGGRPNCLGKAQLLAAFAKLAGAKAYGVTPVIGTYWNYRRHRGDIARRVLRAVRNAEIQLLPNHRRSLESIAEEGNVNPSGPSRFHLAVIFELQDGDWLLVDPNSNVFGLVPNPTKLRRKCQRLDWATRVSPGMTSQIVFNDSILRSRKHACANVPQVLSEMGELTTLPDGGRMSSEVALEHFQRTEAFKAYAKDLGGKTNAAGAVLGLRDWLGLPASGTDPGAPEITFRDALAQFRLIHLVNRFDATWEAGESARHDPIVELSNLHFSIACGTISHAAIEMGYGERAEQLLQRHCFNQFRLLYAGAFPEREQSEVPITAARKKRANLAYRVLASLPYRNHSAQDFVDGIVESIELDLSDFSFEIREEVREDGTILVRLGKPPKREGESLGPNSATAGTGEPSSERETALGDPR